MVVNYVKVRKCQKEGCGIKYLGQRKEGKNWCDNCLNEYRGLKIRECSLNYHSKCTGKFFMLKLDQTSCQFCAGMDAEILQTREHYELLA